jgi:hypothetical protein
MCKYYWALYTQTQNTNLCISSVEIAYYAYWDAR